MARACIARIDALDPTFNAFCWRDAETTLNMAKASETRWQKGQPNGLVDGVPTTIKDLYRSKGWPTLRGSRTVADAALMLTVMSQPDPRAWLALPHDAVDYRVGLDEGVAGLRIAYSLTLGYVKVDPEVAAAVRNAAETFAALGARVEEVDPCLPDPIEIFNRHWFVPSAYVVSQMAPARRELLDPGFRAIAEQGLHYSALDTVQASVERGHYAVAMGLFLDQYDLLITPTLPLPAFDAGQLVADPATQPRWTDWTPFTYPFNLTQQPAASVPVGLTCAGLPIGLQIVAAKYQDARLLRAARALENHRPFATVARLADGG